MSKFDFPAIGIIALYTKTFRTFPQNAVPLIGLAIVPAFLTIWLTDFLPSNLPGLTFDGGIDPVAFLSLITLSLITSTTAEIMISRYLIDRSDLEALKLNAKRRTSLLGLFLLAIYRLPFVMIAGLFITAAYSVGMLAIVIGSMWVLAAMSMIGPIFGNETGQGLGLRRSVTLTKNYRWPIALALLLNGFVVIGIELGLTVILGQTLGSSYATLTEPTYLAIRMTVSTIELAFLSTFFSNVYIRLRAIKEDTEVASVFD